MSNKGKTLFAVIILYCVICPSPSYSYLDPNTLGMVFQVIVAGIAGVFMFFKFGYSSIKNFFSGLFKKDK